MSNNLLTLPGLLLDLGVFYNCTVSTGKIKIVTGENMFNDNESKPEVEWKEKVIEPKPILDEIYPSIYDDLF